MKGIQSNGFLPIIAQAIAEMEELHGEFAGINEINLAELGRRTGISRAKLRRLKANGFCETPHGLIDCYEYYHPDRSVIQSGPVAFCGWLETKDCRPYRTEVQLYKSLLFLKRSIDRDLIVSAQREALQTLRCIISNLEYRFYKAYGMEIEDKRTVYGECTYRLVPREDEPSVCLMHDWIYLPTA